jgi:hypothetical protein
LGWRSWILPCRATREFWILGSGCTRLSVAGRATPRARPVRAHRGRVQRGPHINRGYCAHQTCCARGRMSAGTFAHNGPIAQWGRMCELMETGAEFRAFASSQLHQPTTIFGRGAGFRDSHTIRTRLRRSTHTVAQSVHYVRGYAPTPFSMRNRFGVRNTPSGVRTPLHRPPVRTNRPCGERRPDRRESLTSSTSLPHRQLSLAMNMNSGGGNLAHGWQILCSRSASTVGPCHSPTAISVDCHFAERHHICC